MSKKIIALILSLVLIFVMSACAGNEDLADDRDRKDFGEAQSENSGQSHGNEDASNQFTTTSWEEALFMGFNIYYPADAIKDPSNYGDLIGNENYCVIVEAPATAGKIFTATDLGEAMDLCEQYVFETLEHKIRSLFDYDKTVKTITKTEEVTYNGVKMLLVDGFFTNTETEKDIPFSAIYLLAGEENNLPVYIVGVPMEDGQDVTAIVKEMAKKISK